MTKYLETKKNSLEDAVLRMKEKLVGGQKKLDKDKDGDIDGKDFAILRKQAKNKKKNEAAKPDFLDLDKDGNKKEPMKVAAKQAKAKKEEVEIDEKFSITLPPVRGGKKLLNIDMGRAIQMLKDFGATKSDIRNVLSGKGGRFQNASGEMFFVQRESVELDEYTLTKLDKMMGIKKGDHVFFVSGSNAEGNIYAQNEKEAMEKAKKKGIRGKISIRDKGEYKGQPRLVNSVNEGYESEVLKVLRDADVEGYFKMGKLYVSRRDARDAKKALEDSDEITKLPKMGMEDEKMKKLTKRQRQALARVQAQPKSKVSLPKMPDFMKPKKEEVEININEKTEYVEYKFKNRGDAMKAKRYFDGIQLMDFDVNDDNISNGELMVDAGNRDMTRYHKEIVKKFSPKVMKTEAYEIGNDYAKHTLEVTPGQSRDDVDEMLGIAEKKRTSMREALAKMWGMNEGKNPFEKSEKKDLTKEGEHDKTLTGKKPTKIEVDPELKDK